MRMMCIAVVIGGAVLGNARLSVAQATSAFMRMKNGTDYNMVSLAATDAYDTTYPSYQNNMNTWVRQNFVDGNNIVNTTLGSAATGAGNKDGVSGTYQTQAGPGHPAQSTTESASWTTGATVTTSVSPRDNTQLQPGIGINDLHQQSYTLQIGSTDPNVDDEIVAGVSCDSADATGLYQEPFPGPQFDFRAAPVQFAAVTLDPVQTPVGTVKTITGSLMVVGQANFNGNFNQGGATCAIDIEVNADGAQVANVIIQNNQANYAWTLGGTQYFESHDFTLTNSPSFTIDFDGTATISDQSAPVTVIEVAFQSTLHVAEDDQFNDDGWGATGWQPRIDAPGGYNGGGGGQTSFELMINLDNP